MTTASIKAGALHPRKLKRRTYRGLLSRGGAVLSHLFKEAGEARKGEMCVVAAYRRHHAFDLVSRR